MFFVQVYLYTCFYAYITHVLIIVSLKKLVNLYLLAYGKPFVILLKNIAGRRSMLVSNFGLVTNPPLASPSRHTTIANYARKAVGKSTPLAGAR